MKSQTYSIVRVHRDRDGDWEKIVASGLDWETARRKAVELSTAERVANPAKTSWTLDISTASWKAPSTIESLRVDDDSGKTASLRQP